MSYNGETIKDEALEIFTMGIMEDVVRHYKDKLGDNHIDKIIERGVAKKLVEWIPEKYTEVDIKAVVGRKYVSVITEFMTDAQTMMVVIHEEALPAEKLWYAEAGFNKGKISEMIKEKVSLGLSPNGCGSTAEERLEAFRMRHGKHPMAQFNGYDDEGNYMPEATSVDFINPSNEFHAKCRAYDAAKTKAVDEGIVVDSIIPTKEMFEPRGSKVETLPSGEGLGAIEDDMSYFRGKLMNGLKRTINPPYTKERFDVAAKAEAEPQIDFTAISGIDPAKAQDWNRNTDSSRSTYYSIDVNAAMKESIMDAEKETMISTTSKRLQELADQLAYDTMVGTSTTAAAEDLTNPLTMAELQEMQAKYTDWACGTSGWSREYTNAMFDDIPKRTDEPNLTWTTPAKMSWYNNPYPLTSYDPAVANGTMEEISFTESDLDELIDLVNEVQSEVMNFE